MIFVDEQSKRKGKRYEVDEDKSETRQLEISAQIIYSELLGQILFGNWIDNPGKIAHQRGYCSHHYLTDFRNSQSMSGILPSTYTIAIFPLHTLKSLFSAASIISLLLILRIRKSQFFSFQSNVQKMLFVSHN